MYVLPQQEKCGIEVQNDLRSLIKQLPNIFETLLFPITLVGCKGKVYLRSTYPVILG